MNLSGLEACYQDLFSDLKDLELKYNKETVAKVVRVRDMYLHILKTPSMTDSEVIRTFTARYKISRPTAYSDLSVVKALLPMLSKEAREFHRWRTLEMLLETYRIAKAKMDVRTMERTASSYGKYTNSDKPDEETIDMSKVIPVQWIPTDDPTVLGLPKLENREEKIRELLNEFSATTPEILDIDYEEPDLDPLNYDPLNKD